ncbi:MAG: hypothetical protein KatS3mg004_2551 [Bryobacteraceae bacterium]|nr:MAG: hypothetical protein KatS3mg004_2551 [Bryobacteraceae bacterium]
MPCPAGRAAPPQPALGLAGASAPPTTALGDRNGHLPGTYDPAKSQTRHRMGELRDRHEALAGPIVGSR